MLLFEDVSTSISISLVFCLVAISSFVIVGEIGLFGACFVVFCLAAKFRSFRLVYFCGANILALSVSSVVLVLVLLLTLLKNLISCSCVIRRTFLPLGDPPPEVPVLQECDFILYHALLPCLKNFLEARRTAGLFAAQWF